MAIKLLIVDDSALMRRQLVRIFEDTGDFDIRVAKNGQEAIDENLKWQPDVVTLDINMPEMDGITALAYMMATRPVPVVMVSSLTEKGALATFEALALGAIDYVTKPDGTISLYINKIEKELVAKVRTAAGARLKVGKKARITTEELNAKRVSEIKSPTLKQFKDTGVIKNLVLIGVSTGGPSTLEQILPRLPEDYPFPIIVAQHMPSTFTGPFANRLNNLCSLNVVEANKLMELKPGTIYISKGGADVVISNRGGQLVVLPRPESPHHLWHPSVEVLGRSALENLEASRIIAVMLTGMGDDGAAAFTEIKKKGGRTIAESEDSAVVFGMPKELIEHGGASVVLPLSKIAPQLISWARN